MIKDHYATLHIPPQSGIQDIKRAYRKLAMQYHPDKNDDPRSAILFREVQEAYRVLSDPLLREKYHHERWANRYTGKDYAKRPVTTAYGVLLKAVELEKFMQRADPFRADRDGLTRYIIDLLNEDHRKILDYNKDVQLNKRIASLLMHSGRILQYKQVIQVIPHLKSLSPSLENDLQRWERNSRADALWNRYMPLVALALALLLSIGIYLLAR